MSSYFDLNVKLKSKLWGRNIGTTIRDWIFDKNYFSCDITHYGKILISLFQLILLVLAKCLGGKTGNYSHFHNILRLFDVLPNFPFTTSERISDYYL